MTTSKKSNLNWFDKGNYLQDSLIIGSKNISKSLTKLNYPTHLLQVGEDVCEEYEIPEEDMQEMLNTVYPLADEDHIDANQRMLDFSTSKVFLAKEFKVIWHHGVNILVTPCFSKTGGHIFACVKYRD